jgi:hypothetical protein
MRILWSISLSLLLVLIGTAQVSAQDIVIHAVNGKNGQPIAKNHLLVWAFDQMSDRMTRNGQQLDLYTNENGIAVIPSGTIKLSHLQVWVDGHTQCNRDPNAVSLSVDEIRRKGINAENNCSHKITVAPQPNTLVIYARPATFFEGMRW